MSSQPQQQEQRTHNRGSFRQSSASISRPTSYSSLISSSADENTPLQPHQEPYAWVSQAALAEDGGFYPSLDQEGVLEATKSTSTTGSVASSSKSRGWNSLKSHLLQGDLLLTAQQQRQSYRGISILESGQPHSTSPLRRTRSSLRRQAFEEFQSGTTFSVRQCLLAIVIYLALSIAMFSFVLEPPWTVIDSCYFAVSTFTTLGYGDLYPTHMWSVVFTCVYALLGVACLGLALGVLGTRLIESREQAVQQANAVSKYQVLTLFDQTRHGNSNNNSPTAISQPISNNGTSCQEQPVGSSSIPKARLEGYGFLQDFQLGRFVLLVTVMFCLAFAIAHQANWGILSTIYYMIITGCTIGYGDMTPASQSGRLLATFFIPISCLVTGHCLGYFAHRIVDSRSSSFIHNQIQVRELTQDDLDAMDVNGDGKVTRAEFLEFTLVAMNKIDWDLVDELEAYFNKLDVAGTGELSREDLVEMARRKLRSPRRKLALAAYKQKLLDQAAAAAEEKRLQRRPTIFDRILHRLPSFLGDDIRSSRIWQSFRLPNEIESFLSVESSDGEEGRPETVQEEDAE